MVHFSYTLYCSQLNYDSALRGINKHTRHSHFTTRIIIMGQKYNTSSTNTTESSNNQGPSREFRKIPFPKETNRTEIKMGLESPVNWAQVSRQPHQWCARSHTYASVCVCGLHWSRLSATLEKLLKSFKDFKLQWWRAKSSLWPNCPFRVHVLTTRGVKVDVLN